MDLTDITVYKDGHAVIDGAEGRLNNGKLEVRDLSDRLEIGDRVKISAADGFAALGTFMGVDADKSNFKID